MVSVILFAIMIAMLDRVPGSFEMTGTKTENSRPNIIVILIDDQDWVLGGLEPMTITRRLIVDREQGATFTNAFVSTPVCCPSRSSILTGKYVHNHGVINNTVSGNCSSLDWQNGPEQKTMATYLQSSGYTTFYGGKYLNQYGKNETGGVKWIPPGYDCWIGLVGNSHYYNYSLSVDGEQRDHGDNYNDDYFTDVLAREALKFITAQLAPSPFSATNSSLRYRNRHHQKKKRRRPFFAMIAPPACHSPFTPAPQFAHKFADRRAPRWPSFNRHPGMDKHWLVRQAPFGPLPQKIVNEVDHIFRQRWRTLLSVDHMIGKLFKLLRATGQLDNTYIVLTSDHGYHLGQFTLPADKRLPYETDIRVPLIIKPIKMRDTSRRRSSIQPILIPSLTVVSIDLAPTVLDMAGISTPNDMDGISLLPLILKRMLTDDINNTSTNTMKLKPWRTSFLIEYYGEASLSDVDPSCPQDPYTTLCLQDFDCKCQDSANNTYSCLRTLSSSEDSLYCHFADQEKFVEFYDLQRDPYQLNNTAFIHRPDGSTPGKSVSSCTISRRHLNRLTSVFHCQGYDHCFH